MSVPVYPGAVAPERDYDLHSYGQRLRLHEWGSIDAPPVVLCHGLWDHTRGYDLVAPLLARHYRVIGLDARGHGDSAWADNYPWPQDVHDVLQLLSRIGPAHLIGHSRGGAIALAAACAAPELTRRVVTIEGFGPATISEPMAGHVGQPAP